MALKKAEKKVEQNFTVEVKRAHEFKSGDISFDLIVNGVNLYGLTYINENPEKNIKKPFVSFPAQLSRKDGKYYNHCWFSISDELLEEIEKGIEACL